MQATTHYPIGGSTVALAEKCAGSVKARKELGEQPSGPAAARGTRIHSYVELLWVQEYSPTANLTKENREFIKTMADDERQVGLALYEAVKQVCLKLGFSMVDLQLEKQFPFMHPIAGGTPDIFGLKVFGDILMVDIKTGRHLVKAENNVQELFYLCTILRNIDPFTVSTLVNAHLVILQADSDAPIVTHDIWTIPVAELRHHDLRFENVVKHVKKSPDERTAGEHCGDMWCSVRATCQIHVAWQTERSNGRIAELERNQDPGDVDTSDLAEQLKAIPSRKQWAKSIIDDCERIEQQAKDLMRQVPNAVPGFTLKTSYGNRYFLDEKALIAAAKEVGLKPADLKSSKLMSPNQIEKLCMVKKLPHGWVDGLAGKPETGQSIVPGEARTIGDIFMGAV